MTRSKFNNFRIKDLTGGINVRDYPSKIEDKQMINLENWNFKGDKLVTSKGMEDLGFDNGSGDPIRGLIKDGEDVWHIQSGILYKNGERKTAEKILDINITNLEANQNPVEFYLDGNLVSSNAPTSNPTDIYQRMADDIDLFGGYITEVSANNLRIVKEDFTTFTTEDKQELLIDVQNRVEGVDFDLILDGTTYTATHGASDIESIANIISAVNAGTGFLAGYFSDGGVIGLRVVKDGYNTFTYNIGTDLYLLTRTKNIRSESSPNEGQIYNNLTYHLSFYKDYIYMTHIFGQVKPTRVNTDTGIILDIDGVSDISHPKCHVIYNGKLIFGGYEGSDVIVFSKTDEPTNPDYIVDFSGYSAGTQSVGGTNKGTLTGFSISENGLYVFKEREIWYSNSEQDDGSTSFNFIFNKITSNGCLNQDCITEVGQEIFYYDHINRAVRRLSYEQNLTTLRDTSISTEIEDIIQGIAIDGGNNESDAQQGAVAHYKYPNYRIYLREKPITTTPLGVNDLCLVYNVYNKSWTKETNVYTTKAYEGIIGDNGIIYKLDSGNTSANGTSLSKEYSNFSTTYISIDDVDYKRFGELEIVGTMRGESGTKTLEIEVLIDGENTEVGEDGNPYKRIITAEDGEEVIIREKIELYDDGRKIQFKLNHSGDGYIEITDANFRVKQLKTSEYYY